MPFRYCFDFSSFQTPHRNKNKLRTNVAGAVKKLRAMNLGKIYWFL